MALEIACVDVSSSPTRDSLKKIYNERHGNALFPLVVVASSQNTSWILGPNPESPTLELQKVQAQRILQEALNEPNQFAAIQRLAQLRQALQSTDEVGLANAGLFANHHLKVNVPQSPSWGQACERSRALLSSRGRDLIQRLGFIESRAGAEASVLKTDTNDRGRAVAILLNEDEQFDALSHRFNLTPIAYGLSVAAKSDVPWLIVLRGSQIRLYPAKDGVGVGQRSQAETYFELDLSLLPDEKVGMLDLIFSATALAVGGTVEELLKGSARFAADLGTRLRNRIYEHVVPDLARGVAGQLPSLGLAVNSENLELAYRLTLRILFRLLFQAYAEDRGLLPYDRNERFTANALKTLVIRDLLPNSEGNFDSASTALWDDLQQVWKVIDGGDSAWNIPAYNGGLFGRDPQRHGEGALIAQLSIPNDVMGPALSAMLIDIGSEGVPGPVDFGTLSVREFGTIYEGLLESSLSLADSDLTLDSSGAWVPATYDDEVFAAEGTPYFHNASGERKATGSYFTPSVIVEHLLDKALEPALEQHLAKITVLLEAGKEADAADAFFDFRVADLAMGSAHFLVAAVDRIETAFRNYLVEHPIPRVRAELARLGEAARQALGSDAEFIGDIDDALLLRRQIARRCIYGIDINEMAVELARLALWIHTFVPGLPMSSLDHGLVCANSLTGIGSIDEALEALDPNAKGDTLFTADIRASLNEAAKFLREAADSDELNKQEIAEARELSLKAREAAEPIKHVFDAAVAARLKMEEVSPGTYFSLESIVIDGKSEQVLEKMRLIKPAHMPYLFPEVFLRDNGGFDALLGNPPWEELSLAESKFWKRYSLIPTTGKYDSKILDVLRAKRPDLAIKYEAENKQVEILREAVVAGPYKGMGTGDPDLYKGFAWRNLISCRKDGFTGLVLPLGAWSAKGSADWRSSFIAATSSEIDLFRNVSGWVFTDVNPGYRFTTVSAKSDSGSKIKVRGEFLDIGGFQSGKNSDSPEIQLSKLLENDPEVCIPTVSSESELSLWTHLISFPAFSNGRENPRSDFVCAPATEIHVTNEGKNGGVFTDNPNDFPIYNHLNIDSFNFEPANGVFNFAAFEKELDRQNDLRKSNFTRKASPFSVRGTEWNLDPSTHPILHPRIGYRAIIHATNKRKAWFGLVPAKTLLTNAAPYLVFSEDNIPLQAYVLGMLNSPAVDWFAHLRVNLNMNFFILYTLPVPTYTGSKRQLRISELTASIATAGSGDFGDWEKFASNISTSSQLEAARLEVAALSCMEFRLNNEQLKVIFGQGNTSRVDLIKILDELERLSDYAD